MTYEPPKEHSPEHIAHFVREFVKQHKDNAEDVACEHMFAAMADQDAKEAAFWLAVIHEIRQISGASTAIN